MGDQNPLILSRHLFEKRQTIVKLALFDTLSSTIKIIICLIISQIKCDSDLHKVIVDNCFVIGFINLTSFPTLCCVLMSARFNIQNIKNLGLVRRLFAGVKMVL